MDAKRDLVFGTVLFVVRELLKKRFWNHFEVPSVSRLATCLVRSLVLQVCSSLPAPF